MNLIEAASRGGPEAIEALIASVWRDAFRIAFSVLRDRELAEDAAQEACAILYRSIRSLRSSGAFKVWFFRIVMREALKLERKHASVWGEPLDSHGGGIAAIVLKVDIREALFKLPTRQRAALVLHYYADLTSFEIAEILEIPDSSVRFHIMRAKRALHHILSVEFANAV